MKRHLLWLPLALGAPAALTLADALAPAAVPTEGEYEELVAAFDGAYQAWRTEFDAAETRERSALRKRHPVHEYWTRFEALGQMGEGRGFLWMVEKVKDRGLKKVEKGPVLRDLYTALLKGSAGEAWFDTVIGRIGRDARYVGEEEVERWLAAASKSAKAPMSKALATLKLAEILADSDDEERKLRGEELLDEYEQRNILAGATALDFRAQTIEGHAFNLSDYRGKAVLVDFYGFW